MTIVARNLSPDVTEADLRKLFQEFGEVAFVNIIRERDKRTSAGFGFIAMPVEKEAEAAIAELHLKVVRGKAINVNDARPQILS